MLDQAYLAYQQDKTRSLRVYLLQNEQQVLKLISAGSLSSFSKNSVSQSYATGGDALSQGKIQRCWRALIGTYDYCLSELQLEQVAVPIDPQYPEASAAVPPTDDDVYNRMVLILQPITEYTSDLTELLLPPTLTPPVPMTQ